NRSPPWGKAWATPAARPAPSSAGCAGSRRWARTRRARCWNWTGMRTPARIRKCRTTIRARAAGGPRLPYSPVVQREEAMRPGPVRAVLSAACCLVAAVMAADERESFDLHVPVAPSPVMSGGHARLFYELHLTNFSGQPLAPQAVEVLDGHGRSLARFDGAALAARLAPVVPGGGAFDGTLAPGMRAVVFVELDLEPGALPDVLRHRVGYRVEDGTGAQAEVAGGPAPVAPPAVVLGQPLRGGPWAAVFDPGWERGHRRVFYAVEGRATLPGCLAIDFVKLDGGGRIAEGDPDVIRGAYGY